MKTKLLHVLAPALGVLLFTGALFVLHQELKVYHLKDIVQELHGLPLHRLVLAFCFTVLSYLCMTGYDFLAIRYLGQSLGYPKTALASFIGYAFSNNVGLSMVAGSSVRFRLYSAWGLSATEIAKVVLLCTATLWLGFFTLAGVVFIAETIPISPALHLPFSSTQPVGAFFLLIVAACSVLVVRRTRPFKIGEWEFSVPPKRLFFFQVMLACFDWFVSGCVLYILLPPSPQVSCFSVLMVFLLGQLAGLASQIPGGLGVFETVTLLLLSPQLPAPAILGALLAYRGIYYLLPFLIAVVLLGSQEILQARQKLENFARVLGSVFSGLLPQVFSIGAFIAGTLLLFSGATPAASTRLAWLKDFLPLPVIEASHFLGSLAGVALLLLARGLQRRLDAAYGVTVALLGLGVLLSLAKGLNYEEALVLALLLAVLLPCHQHFYRKTSLLNEPFTPGWISAIIMVLAAAAWLTAFSFKHVEYSHDLWWRFTFFEDGPRSLRATVAAISVALFVGLARLLRPGAPAVSLRREQPFEIVKEIVSRSPNTYANLALLGDKQFLLNAANTAFIMYAVEGRSWITMGDPIGPEEEWPDLLWRFREMSDRYEAAAVFYEVGPKSLPLYLDLGLTLLKCGEEGRVSLEKFSMEGGGMKSLRHTERKLSKEGCRFELLSPEEAAAAMPTLRAISDTWIQEKHTREKGFSLGSFKEEYLKHFPAAVVRKEGRIVAFTNLWLSPGKEEVSPDLMRYRPDAPQGIMDYLFVRLILWAQQQGYKWFSLGMAPFAGLENHPLAPLWNRLGALIFLHGEHFYNFQGLRQYKEKFEPEWEPRYLACPGGLALPRILSSIASLIAGGVKGVVAK